MIVLPMNSSTEMVGLAGGRFLLRNIVKKQCKCFERNNG